MSRFLRGDSHERKRRGSLIGLGESSGGEVRLTMSERGRTFSWQYPDHQPSSLRAGGGGGLALALSSAFPN